MSAPNNAYCYGTTPSAGGGVAALRQAIKSMLLGVSTTIASAVSSTGSQVVTPGAMTNIGVGSALWINWGLSDQECVSVTAATGSTFTANFTKTHSANMTVTCGLPTLGVSTPWNLFSYSLTDVNDAYYSAAPTAIGDAGFQIVLVGHNSTANTLGFATSDDADIVGGSGALKNAINYNSSQVTTCMALQDAQFSFWICCCEFGIYVQTLVSATYAGIYCGSLRTPQPLNYRGVGIANAAIASTDTSVTLTTDITSRLQVGQQIMIQNQSHSSASTHYAQANKLLTLASMSGTGSACTLTFTGTVGAAFDTGALVGSVVQNTMSLSAIAPDSGTWYVTHNNDGTYTSVTGNTTQVDTAVITSDMIANLSPTVEPQPGQYGGELDLPIDQNTAGVRGACGFPYCFQEFVPTGVNSQDYFYDGSVPAVWKAFKGSQMVGMGPLTNPLCTQTNPTGWVP